MENLAHQQWSDDQIRAQADAVAQLARYFSDGDYSDPHPGLVSKTLAMFDTDLVEWALMVINRKSADIEGMVMQVNENGMAMINMALMLDLFAFEVLFDLSMLNEPDPEPEFPHERKCPVCLRVLQLARADVNIKPVFNNPVNL